MMKRRQQWFHHLGVALGAAALASCQGHTPQESVPLSVLAWNRAAFGPRPGALDNFNYEHFLEEQLHPAQIPDPLCEERLGQAEFETQDKPFRRLWDEHYLLMDTAESEEDWEQVQLPYAETVQASLIRAVYSRRQLHEVLVDFWHNHFNVYGGHDDVAPLLPAYDRDAIRPHVLGNFQQMLRAVASHPVMLLYLNNDSNEVSGPNENYARELLELHTLGAMHYRGTLDPSKVELGPEGLAEAYVDNDVCEVARCFTGWTLDESDSDDESGGSGRFLCRSDSHDRFNKLVLGRTLRSDQGALTDGEMVLEMLANHRATAQHIAWKLCRRLVADNPSADLVRRAAQVFRKAGNDPDQLRQVVGMVLRSPEFLASWGGKVKRPLEFAISLVRALDVDFQPEDDFLGLFDSMGQPLFGRQTPDGYPDVAEAWQHTSSLLFRWRLAQRLLKTARLRATKDVAWWSQRLLGRPGKALASLSHLQNPEEIVALLAMSPDFQLR